MTAKNLISFFNKKENEEVFELVSKFPDVIFSGAGNFSSKSFLMADILREYSDFSVVLWVVNDFTEQEQVARMLKIWTPYNIYSFGVTEEVGVDPERETKLKITELISVLTYNKRTIVVAAYNDILRKFPLKSEISEKTLKLNSKRKTSVMKLFDDLIERGYEVSRDTFLSKGAYFRQGGVLTIFPVNMNKPIRVEADFDTLGNIFEYDQRKKEIGKKLSSVDIYPLGSNFEHFSVLDFLNKNSWIVLDEVEVIDELCENWEQLLARKPKDTKTATFTSFLEEEKNHEHLHFLSVLKYRTVHDFTNDLKEKNVQKWKTFVFSKHPEETSNMFKERGVLFVDKLADFEAGNVFLVPLDKDEVSPYAFQNPKHKILIISDREIAPLKETKKAVSTQKVYLDFLTGLKAGDYVVHADHGIAVFQGLERRTVDKVTREYLKLGYAENDKLFVPIDQADKVNKYIGAGDQVPRLTRLGSAEWVTLTSRVKRETQKIAKELLQLYAEREQAEGFMFKPDDRLQRDFECGFPYEETPGQIKAILDVKSDMEKKKTMDRLICGDVGFGKTEVAMRAAFKAVRSGKQVAFISPITILTDQHYRSFKKRMDGFLIRVEMLSRFKTKKEQKEILKDLARGNIDIVIGTHRLLQEDVKFKDLGLVIIDEEQRFGVKQKEKLKEIRKEVDILTLTATPIPRTLNISLNKLRDITTITTPPPGRLPVITEVRRYSNELIREVILKEIERSGQVYFLHNRVQTIDGLADKLRSLVPEARFIVAHGKLCSTELEDRIISFKERKYDVLVSSTIIENGIDLPNANTLIVNNAEKFGLAQLYQLRGRVGRGRKQAYAYFLYQSQRLKFEAKKRLRAIVEASELGSGFQIAMKDLELRGAGDILGANQHGAINVVGVSHFVRMLNQAVESLKAGSVAKTEKPIEVSIELPLPCYIPDKYIVKSKDKINVYQKLAAADSRKYLDELKEELVEDYGKMPREVSNLFRILDLKLLAKKANLTNVKAENIHSEENKEIILTMSDKVKPENIVNLLEYNQKWIVSGTKLKIKAIDLGMQWFDELKECVSRLGEKMSKKKLQEGRG